MFDSEVVNTPNYTVMVYGHGSNKISMVLVVGNTVQFNVLWCNLRES